jgi:transposase
MAALTESAQRKLSLLRLAEQLGNVAKAARIMGYHRDTFYEVRKAFQSGGVSALNEQRRGPRSPHPSRVSKEIESAILEYCLTNPSHGAQRVANELRLRNVKVSSSGVRGVWLRNNLETRQKRAKTLESRTGTAAAREGQN